MFNHTLYSQQETQLTPDSHPLPHLPESTTAVHPPLPPVSNSPNLSSSSLSSSHSPASETQVKIPSSASKTPKRHPKSSLSSINKDARINIRLNTHTLNALKLRAQAEGLPYQTMVASLIHRYLTGQLVDIGPCAQCTSHSSTQPNSNQT